MSFPYSALCAQLFDALSAEVIPEQLAQRCAVYRKGDNGGIVTTTTFLEATPEDTCRANSHRWGKGGEGNYVIDALCTAQPVADNLPDAPFTFDRCGRYGVTIASCSSSDVAKAFCVSAAIERKVCTTVVLGRATPGDSFRGSSNATNNSSEASDFGGVDAACLDLDVLSFGVDVESGNAGRHDGEKCLVHHLEEREEKKERRIVANLCCL